MTHSARRLAAGATAASLAALVVLAVLVPPARTAGPGAWTEVQGPNLLHPASQISAARGLDGSLYVAFTDSPDNNLAVSKLGPDGTRLSTEPAIDASSTRPTIVTDPAPEGTVRALYGGFRNPPGDSGIWMATAPVAGTPWSSTPAKVSSISSSYTAAAVDPNGVLYTAATIGDPTVHRGTNPADSDHVYDTEGGQQGGLALDGASGAPTLAWLVGVTGGAVELRTRSGSASTGEPTGTVVKAPGLSGATANVRVNQNVPISGRTGRAGIYVAYADANGDQGKLLLWRVGEALPTQVALSSSPITKAALAPAPDGSLWIAWVDDAGAQSRVAARELAPDGTTLGPITSFDVPDTGGFLNVGQLVGVAQADRIDLLLVADAKIYHSQVPAVGGGPPPPGQPHPGIAGRVVSSGSLPIFNATVEACPQPSGLCLAVYTDVAGRFALDGPPAGTYRLRVFPPPSTLYDTVTGPELTVTDGLVDVGDLLMRGPIPLPSNAFISFPSIHGTPVIRRSYPITMAWDVPVDAVDPKIVIMGGTDDPEALVDIPGAITPGGDCPVAVRRILSDVYICEYDAPEVPPGEDLPPSEPPWLPNGTDPPPCPIGTVTGVGNPPDCTPLPFPLRPKTDMSEQLQLDKECPAGKTGTPPYCQGVEPPVQQCPLGFVGTPPSCTQLVEPPKTGFTKRVAGIVKFPSGGPLFGEHIYTTCIVWNATYTFRDPFPEPLRPGETGRSGYISPGLNYAQCNTVWVDPSGFVRSTKGVGIPGAKVVLQRSDLAAGPFSQVANGSARMAPVNRHNPDRTDKSGHFGWDVVSGYYRVRATKTSCTDPRKRKRKFAQTKSLQVPPPVFNLDMRLRCPPAPAPRRKPAIKGKVRAGSTVQCARGSWRGRPKRYGYLWIRDGIAVRKGTHRRLRLRAGDRRQRVACLVTASNSWGARTVRTRAIRVR